MKNYKLAKLLIIFFVFLCICTSLFYGDELLLGSFSEFNNDDVKYLRSADTLIKTGKLTYNDTNKPTVFIMPGIVLFLVPFVKAFGMENAVVFVQIFQALVQGLTLYLIYKIYIKYINKRTAVFGLVLNLIYLPNIYITTIVLTETVFVFLLACLIYFLLQALDSKAKKDYFIAGIFWGLASLFRPSISVIPILVLFMWLLRKYTIKEMTLWTSISIIPFIVLFSPWWIRNYITFDKFIPFTLSSGNPMLQGAFINNQVDNNIIEKINDEKLLYNNDEINNNYVESRLAQKVFKYYLKQNSIEYIKWFLIDKPIQNLKNPYYNYNIYGIDYKTANIEHFILLLLSIIGMFISKAKNKYLIIGLVIYFLLIHIPFLSYSRYIYPVMPFIIPMAANIMEFKVGEALLDLKKR